MYITINIQKFKNISLEQTLNYNHFQELEGSVSSIVNSINTDIKNSFISKSKLTPEQKISYFLSQSLLSITSNERCIEIFKRENLDEDYIYIVLKKFYFKTNNDLQILIS